MDLRFLQPRLKDACGIYLLRVRGQLGSSWLLEGSPKVLEASPESLQNSKAQAVFLLRAVTNNENSLV
jgi:hypothetical protein